MEHRAGPCRDRARWSSMSAASISGCWTPSSSSGARRCPTPTPEHRPSTSKASPISSAAGGPRRGCARLLAALEAEAALVELLNAYIDHGRECAGSSSTSRSTLPRWLGLVLIAAPARIGRRDPRHRRRHRPQANPLREHHERGQLHRAGLRPDAAFHGVGLARYEADSCDAAVEDSCAMSSSMTDTLETGSRDRRERQQ